METVQNVTLSVEILRALKEKLILFRDNDGIGFSCKNHLSINGLIDSIGSYFDVKAHIQPNLESVVEESISNIVEGLDFNLNKVCAKLANFLTYYAEFVSKTDSTYKNTQVINLYMEETKKVVGDIRNALDAIILEMERIEYTFKVTGDYGLLNAYSFLKQTWSK